ncbi:hypothetical protein LTR37_003764 [Vermiconidia calcicola]|uniref:Uncharacterized protein n=1 Tax=Vermiconidia calcicola TaxID=1690605 RepID=A0ACC3NRK4_9PEZI|nr:hypothetical protein LTR37_003764 [Vermiconidia calcicola]
MGSIGETQDPPPFQPPPFEPPLAVLKTQAATIQAAVAEYELAKTPDDKARAVINIAVASQMLSTITTSPGAVVQRFAFQPVSNAAVRVAIGMGLFNQLSPSKPATTKELAAKCNSDAEFVQRIARAVASLGMLQEVSEETYAHTPISMILSDDTAQASLAQMLDNVGVTMMNLNSYYREHGYKSPADVKNTPTVYARGLKDVGYFEWLTQSPELYTVFNKAMAFHSLTGVNGIATAYPWDKLQPGPDGVTVVDVGGGKGHALKEIIRHHPSISGHAVLEDLENVLADGTLVSSESVKTVPYDFLGQEQPVKGAAAYMFRHCFCDWPDEECLKILDNHIPAMQGFESRLLLSDLVLPDEGADASKTLRDINMMQCSGKERSEKQWHALLDKAGFRIVHIYCKDDAYNSLVEAVLKD